jgi:N4-gp56 family major capsid protein
MAETQLNVASRVQKWDSDFFAEYVRDNRFRPYMGRSDGNSLMPFVTKYELSSGGKTVNIPLITRLKGGGVFGTERLIGSEEALGNYNKAITIQWNRNGVTIKKPEEHWTEMDLRRGARAMLKAWAAESLRDDMITALLDVTGLSYVGGRNAALEAGPYRSPLAVYTAFSEDQKDAWLAANADRVLFGAAVSNNNANDHSASLLNVDTTADRLSTSIISLAKQMAQEADPKIRPFRTQDSDGREYFVLFVGSRGFRDLKRDSAMLNANRDARPRDVSANPIFQDGDLIYDGIIVREVPEIPVLGNVGASTSAVAPAFLCGAQAVGLAWGQEPVSRTKKEDDYGFEHGVSIEECRGVSKLIYNSVQHGMVTIYHSAPATAA